MRLKDFPIITPEQIAEDDVMVLDGPGGTRNVNAKNLLANAGGSGSDIELPFDLRKLIWRGKNLGGTFTDEQKKAINDGTFENLYLGDYWSTKYGNVTIVDFDYWALFNGVSKKHHLVVMPTYIDSEADCYVSWNSLSNKTGGYNTSVVREALNDDSISGFKKKFITPIFGDNLMPYGASLSSVKAISNENVTNISYENDSSCTLELLTEKMIFGSGTFGLASPMVNKDPIASKAESDTRQLLAFKLYFYNMIQGIYTGWLRDISGPDSASAFSWYYKNCFKEEISMEHSCFLTAFAVIGDE